MTATTADLVELQARLAAATSRIEKPFFQLEVAGGERFYRERVYSYELYHQLRLSWGACKYSLNGEIDKSSHSHFRGSRYARAKPDLLVHVPGSMDDNLAIVEIKSIEGENSGWMKDLEKLSWFVTKAAYAAGMFLVYGGTAEQVSRRCRTITGALASPNEKVAVWAHPAPGQAAVLCGSLQEL